MANSSRQYAENLVGALNRSSYDTQRDLAQQAYNTNWQSLQNQYKNLQEKLKKQQEDANLAYSKGLTDVAENSYDRMYNANANLANRGLTTSGIRNLAQQQDITSKGEEVGDLLSSLGDVALSTASQLASGTTSAAQEATDLGKDLSDLLGDIGSADAEAQMAYNNALADIAEGKVARDEANELAAKQRALSAAYSGSGSGEDDELEEFYKRQAISEILVSPTMSDKEKMQALQVNFGIKNASDVIDAYNYNTTAKSTYDSGLSALQSDLDKLNKKLKTQKNGGVLRGSYSPNLNKNSDRESILDSYMSNSNFNKNSTSNPSYQTQLNSILQSIADKQNEINNYTSAGITYKDLANLLYGTK